MNIRLLEERLLKLRGQLSNAKQIAGYQVFGPKELILLVEHKPKTIEELGKLKGFPPDGYRVAKLGEAILRSINEPEDRELNFKVTVVGDDFNLDITSLPKSSAFAKR